jgi:8-oxo-dGTP diphosphatase
MTPNKAIVVVVKGIIMQEDHVLLVKRSPNAKVGSHTWECPGGKIDFGETLENALVREVFEETGLFVSLSKLLYATTFPTDPSRQVVLLMYLCVTDHAEVVLSDEHQEFRWVPHSMLPDFLPFDTHRDFLRFGVYATLIKGTL